MTVPAGGRIGVAIVGLSGAVGTTVVAGLELMISGAVGREGLFLGEHEELATYSDLAVAGWDPDDRVLFDAAVDHGVLSAHQLAMVKPVLASTTAWRPIRGRGAGAPHLALRDQIAQAVGDLRDFRATAGLERVVVVNLGPTEPPPERTWEDLSEFEAALDADSADLPVSTLYGYAAIMAGAAYVNFTPSLGLDVPCLIELARRHGVPVAGRDGKTGQTAVKTALAPLFRSRALRVRGWFSLNLLGNGDGATLRDTENKRSKIATKEGVLDDVLGYPVADHQVLIEYYRPRGDAKEAWDNIDIVGFLGAEMQLKVNFQARDSVLAAPLVIELARCLDLALRRGESAVVEDLAFFFKMPMTGTPGAEPRHDLFEQERALRTWLAGRSEPSSAAVIPTPEEKQ